MADEKPNTDLEGFQELSPPCTHEGVTHRVFWTDHIVLLAGRFEQDRICPRPRLDRLQAEFGDQIIRRELPGGSWLNPPHATLTVDYEKAPDKPDEPTRRWFEEVVGFLRERL